MNFRAPQSNAFAPKTRRCGNSSGQQAKSDSVSTRHKCSPTRHLFDSGGFWRASLWPGKFAPPPESDLGGAVSGEHRVTSLLVVPTLDPSNHAIYPARHSSRIRFETPVSSFIELKKLSVGALPQQCPRWLIDSNTPRSWSC